MTLSAKINEKSSWLRKWSESRKPLTTEIDSDQCLQCSHFIKDRVVFISKVCCIEFVSLIFSGVYESNVLSIAHYRRLDSRNPIVQNCKSMVKTT